jgi:hypothetical protein
LSTKHLAMKGPIVMSKDQRIQAINDKALFLFYIEPILFVKLTIPSHEAMNDIIRSTKPLKFYNDLHHDSQIQYMYLLLNEQTGKIEGHEGRHRMMALDALGVQRVPVFLKAYNRLKKVSDIKFPFEITSEFNNDKIYLTKKDVIEFYPQDVWMRT